MSTYSAKITPQDGSFFTLIVRTDRDGQENVIHGYKSRFFKTKKAAIKSTTKFISEKC